MNNTLPFPFPHPLCIQGSLIKIMNKIKSFAKILCSFVFLIDCCVLISFICFMIAICLVK